jgi:hypothetical protein
MHERAPISLDPAVEAQVVDLLREGKTPHIQVVKTIIERAGCTVGDAFGWLYSYYYRQERLRAKPCPYCGKPLRTNEAKQCFECGADWHGE